MNKTVKKILGVIFDVVIVVIILLAVAITILSLTSKDGVSNILGVMPASVQTKSMEPTIMTGDLILSKKYNGKDELKVGDIVTFWSTETDASGKTVKILVTHRIAEIQDDGVIVAYRTKGDNNVAQDVTSIGKGDIISTYSGTRFANVGTILDFFRSKVGFFMCIIIPLFIFFIYQLYNFIAIAVDYNKTKLIAENRRKNRRN